mgnify:CR=1 FL=1
MPDPTPANRTPATIVFALAILLALLHQDFWFWNNRTLVFGFMPIGLAYHALFSLMAAACWALAVKFAWPTHIEEWADEFEEQAPGTAATNAAAGTSGTAGQDRGGDA